MESLEKVLRQPNSVEVSQILLWCDLVLQFSILQTKLCKHSEVFDLFSSNMFAKLTKSNIIKIKDTCGI